eukprot:g6035.t1
MGAEQSIPKDQSGSQTTPESVPKTPQKQSTPSALVICGPSGVGKGTLIQILLEESEQFAFSVSHTTRAPRSGEKNGVHYHFVSKEEFERGMESGEFLEYASVHENYYGTSRKAVESVLESGACCILDIDVQGARQVRRSGLKAVFVFIAPPSEEELERRLRGRASDSEDQIRIRLKEATVEMESMSEPGLFDFCVVNEDLSQAYAELRLIAMKAKDGLLPGVVAVENGSPSIAKKLETQTPAHMMEHWKGKVALITDACSLVGSELCQGLSKSGMRIIALGKNRDSLQQLQQKVLESGVNAQNLLPVVCDTSKEGEVMTLRKIVTQRWPNASSVSILINIACGFQENASLLGGSANAWVEMLSSNVLATCLCSREILSSMKGNPEEGCIINIGAVVNDTPKTALGLLRATNQAIKSLSDDLRNEMKEAGANAKVVCISNDGVASSAEDVANAVLWVLSAPSGFLPPHIRID